jgi:hypothetical protein
MSENGWAEVFGKQAKAKKRAEKIEISREEKRKEDAILEQENKSKQAI